ncbi:Lef-3 [Epinotia aporema granulovirus]|uniref:Lef-3 n=1 Tax=Epinotia aporema granulovirus TaxID=166056 RepID=K4ER71_9BBAC|nr:Lef-3 [Epinotia aporema granulovirus]AER41534.1 Lef-3 [Epinotia aporema granulovirus]
MSKRPLSFTEDKDENILKKNKINTTEVVQNKYIIKTKSGDVYKIQTQRDNKYMMSYIATEEMFNQLEDGVTYDLVISKETRQFFIVSAEATQMDSTDIISMLDESVFIKNKKAVVAFKIEGCLQIINNRFKLFGLIYYENSYVQCEAIISLQNRSCWEFNSNDTISERVSAAYKHTFDNMNKWCHITAVGQNKWSMGKMYYFLNVLDNTKIEVMDEQLDVTNMDGSCISTINETYFMTPITGITCTESQYFTKDQQKKYMLRYKIDTEDSEPIVAALFMLPHDADDRKAVVDRSLEVNGFTQFGESTAYCVYVRGQLGNKIKSLFVKDSEGFESYLITL